VTGDAHATIPDRQGNTAVQQREQLLSDQLAAPAAQGAHLGTLARTLAYDDRLQVGA